MPIFIGSEMVAGCASRGGGAGLEICDIGLSLYIDETKGLRRYLNGSLLPINQNTQAFLTKLKSIIALYPTLSCTETEWQAEKTLSKFGQVGKFVIDETAGTIRLPAVVNVQGLFDLQNLGLRLDESLPNITGNVGLYSSHEASSGSFYYKNVAGGAGFNSIASGNMIGFDASRSSSTYQDDAPVQQESIQYPYFIQIATGQETEADIVNTLQLNNPYTLFDSKYTETELYNTSWLKADGSWYSGTTYITAYEALQIEANTSITAGTTTSLPSGSNYTKRGLSVVNISLTRAPEIPAITYNDYDFVINTDTQKFRLPTKTNLASGKAVAGNGMSLGITNGTQPNALSMKSDGILTGSYSQFGQEAGTAFTGSAEGGSKLFGVTIDPTKSGIETSSDNLFLYYYIGETLQNVNLIDVARITENFISKNNKEEVISWGLPDYSAGVSVSSLPYTATQTCFVMITASRNENSSNKGYITLNNIKVLPFNNVSNYMIGDQTTQLYLNLGDIINISDNAYFLQGFVFPLKGTN